MKISWFNPLMAFTATVFLILSCSHNKASVRGDEQLTERVFIVNIVNNEQKLKEYLDHHQHVWPEVEAGFKKAGYKKIALYRFDHLLIMNIVVPENANLEAMGKLAESYSPRCAEWNKLMNTYQTGVVGTAQGQTWVEAKPFYVFNNQ